jgi:hypothetical protein
MVLESLFYVVGTLCIAAALGIIILHRKGYLPLTVCFFAMGVLVILGPTVFPIIEPSLSASPEQPIAEIEIIALDNKIRATLDESPVVSPVDHRIIKEFNRIVENNRSEGLAIIDRKDYQVDQTSESRLIEYQHLVLKRQNATLRLIMIVGLAYGILVFFRKVPAFFAYKKSTVIPSKDQ